MDNSIEDSHPSLSAKPYISIGELEYYWLLCMIGKVPTEHRLMLTAMNLDITIPQLMEKLDELGWVYEKPK